MVLVTALEEEEDCDEEDDGTADDVTMLEELWVTLDETEDTVLVETDEVEVTVELLVVWDKSKVYPPTAAMITITITTTATMVVEIPRCLP